MKILKSGTLSDTTLRRLRITPSYFFLVWRWSMWLYALIVILFFKPHYQESATTLPYGELTTLLLAITFIQALIVTFYAPVLRIPFLKLVNRDGLRARLRFGRPSVEDDEPDIVPPLAHTRNTYWDITIYSMDVLICGLVMYYSAPIAVPAFGSGSPFYRYGLSTVFAASLAYRYRGGLAAAIGYDLFAVLGMLLPAPGATVYPPTVIDIVGSLVDAPTAALLTAFMATLIENYAQSKRREQNNTRIQKALVRVGETLMKNSHNRQELLRRSAKQIQQGGHFQRLSIALVGHDEEDAPATQSEISTFVEATPYDGEQPDRHRELFDEVIRSGKNLLLFEPLDDDEHAGCARCYLPLPKDGPVQLILGAESLRATPFDQNKEEFLTIAGTQLLIALENIRLTEQMVKLAASAERGRIAREIHDGIAQLIYMLSLNAETCQAQAQRIAEASEEDAELLTPLATRLGKLVTISKQALWETRNYMFSLKPLMSGTTTLTQMLTNQVREFETISDLPVQLVIEGVEVFPTDDSRRARSYAQAGAALFRIVQEALTNAYKHAEASQIQVLLRFQDESIEVEVHDNGRGLQDNDENVAQGTPTRIYSGHGMNGMRERATELGGTWNVQAGPDGGLTVQACIPLNAKRRA
ncbi:MAG TPA: ATP-binding protein [Ktedonobacteraceae bacterium]|nr:ATP-binding protein [Ktedonobacteraceae bacterium]